MKCIIFCWTKWVKGKTVKIFKLNIKIHIKYWDSTVMFTSNFIKQESLKNDFFFLFAVSHCRVLYIYIIRRSTSLLNGCRCLKRAVCCGAVVDDSLLQIAVFKGVKRKWGFQVIGENPSGTSNSKQEVLFLQVQNRNMVSIGSSLQ